MFKDPFQRGETPYEILGLKPDASAADVQASLPRFMRHRKNLPRLAIAQQALRRLKTAADRACVDIWLYDADAPTAKFGAAPGDLPAVSACPAEHLYFDLLSQEPPEIELDDLRHYDLPDLD